MRVLITNWPLGQICLEEKMSFVYSINLLLTPRYFLAPLQRCTRCDRRDVHEREATLPKPPCQQKKHRQLPGVDASGPAHTRILPFNIVM